MLKLKYDEFVTFQKQNILVGALESLTKIFIYDTDTSLQKTEHGATFWSFV